jgi:hypothetical protein
MLCWCILELVPQRATERAPRDRLNRPRMMTDRVFSGRAFVNCDEVRSLSAKYDHVKYGTATGEK